MSRQRHDEDDVARLAEIAEVEDADQEGDPTGVAAIEDGRSFSAPDAPTASQSYGTTAEEQRAGPSLDRRLREEEADVGAVPRSEDDEEEADVDAEDAALRVVEGADRLPGATDDPVDHYVEDAEAAEDVGRTSEA